MRHRVKKIRFGRGYDFNKMLIRKLLINFFIRAKLETTLKRATAIRPVIEKIVDRAKDKNEANHNYLLKIINQEKVIKILFDQIGPALKDKISGYVRIIKLGQRDSDGSAMARIEWVYPVVLKNN